MCLCQVYFDPDELLRATDVPSSHYIEQPPNTDLNSPLRCVGAEPHSAHASFVRPLNIVKGCKPKHTPIRPHPTQSGQFFWVVQTSDYNRESKRGGFDLETASLRE